MSGERDMKKRITRNMIRSALPKLCYESRRSVPKLLGTHIPRCGVTYNTFKQLVELWHDEYSSDLYSWKTDLWAILGVFASDDQVARIADLTSVYCADLIRNGKAFCLKDREHYDADAILAILEEPFV